VPALLKPAPAGLVTLLWALKNDGKDKPGFGDIVHLLASGRTSVVVNQSSSRFSTSWPASASSAAARCASTFSNAWPT
jgi:hypothetical protein